MSYTIKYVAQCYDNKTGKVIKEQEIKVKRVSLAKSFHEFGLRHKEQIELIRKSQDFLLNFQCQLFSEQTTCPNCSKRLRKQGTFESDFHDVFTDHKVWITRMSCTCGWKNKISINGLYGSATHPELAKLQVTNSANMSFEKASMILNNYSCGIRTINNHVTLIRNVDKIGSLLEQYKKSEKWSQSKQKAKELIIAIDGGHVHHKEEGKRSFEELIATTYRPEDIVVNPSNQKDIRHKVSVGSAKNDSRKTMIKLTKNACL